LAITHQLLGAHICRRARPAHPRPRKLLNASHIDGARDSEIGDNRVTARQQNILGLDVAVDHPLAVRVRERVRYFPRDSRRCVNGELPLAAHSQTESLSAHVGHHVIEKGFDVSRVVERKDVRVLKAREQPDLADETQLTRLGAGIRVQNLEGNLPLVSRVAREVNGSERALADLASDLVASGQRGAERGEFVPLDGNRHRSPPRLAAGGLSERGMDQLSNRATSGRGVRKNTLGPRVQPAKSTQSVTVMVTGLSR
jgi:hypothetical protein